MWLSEVFAILANFEYVDLRALSRPWDILATILSWTIYIEDLLTNPYILKSLLMYELLHVRAGTWDEHLSIYKLPVRWPNQILIMLLYACSHVYLKPTLPVYVCSASACALYNDGVHLVMVIWIYTDIHMYILQWCW